MIVKKCGGTNRYATKERTKYYSSDVPLDKYKADKLKMLKRDFLVELTDEEIEHLNGLETEVQVDRYARLCINECIKYATRK